ncbi:TetR family transcriptional regulator [Nocardia sp. SYP-A9097]|uniref:TetR/AcrR family transcriptional regulator n=1 Tax=Nocardia sp. SYP-A9097 TaxID=2663237 RepID=UPI00129BB6B8|nr:TetR/AcrR family transcriptional regulator [Nocardia sp. SYP-A9097]MRH87903.1 TetR family transcriptional regulator [Nocardia sp. SYP-A9097]
MAGVRGQGRKFDTDAALDAAMLLFWRRGYEATSVAMLTRAMGINPPSLYAAFGGKEEVFFAAVAHYNATRGNFIQRAFDEVPHTPALIRRMLYDAADAYADTDCPGGCLIISAAVGVAAGNQHVADRLRDMRNANIALLTDRLAADKAAARIPPDVDPLTAAEFVGAVIQGMSLRARDGVDVPGLQEIAGMACRALGFVPELVGDGAIDLS